MNCAIHTETPATAYCRTCGKPLCDQCKRDVKSVIYCEDCIAARVQGTFPAGGVAAPLTGSGPNPATATILAIFFPFGVAPVYMGLYAKGLAHLLVFAMLVAGANSASIGHSGAEAFFGLGIAFFYVYQIIDANRSAKALAAGQPAPDPFGLARTFGASNGGGMSSSSVPLGAIVLIGMGVLFLLSNMGWFHFHWIGRLWPLILIAIGVRMFLRRGAQS